MITPFRWQREELALHHPASLSPDAARGVLLALLEAGTIPPRGRNGEWRLDLRCWGGTVEIEGAAYRLLVVRDEATFTAVA